MKQVLTLTKKEVDTAIRDYCLKNTEIKVLEEPLVVLMAGSLGTEAAATVEFNA